MNYSKQLKDYQRIFEKSLKKRFKSIVRVEVDPEEFEDVMENKSTFNIFNVKLGGSEPPILITIFFKVSLKIVFFVDVINFLLRIILL